LQPAKVNPLAGLMKTLGKPTNEPVTESTTQSDAKPTLFNALQVSLKRKIDGESPETPSRRVSTISQDKKSRPLSFISDLQKLKNLQEAQEKQIEAKTSTVADDMKIV
jgi:hypothetical protein